MKRFSFDSLRAKLIILVLIAVFPLFGLTIYTGVQEHFGLRKHALEDALSQAKTISMSMEHLIKKTSQSLFVVAQMLEGHAHQREAIEKVLVKMFHKSPELVGLLVSEPNGKVMASTYATLPDISISDSPYYQRVLQAKKFVIGEYHVSGITGKSILTLSHPALDSTGRIMKIISTGIDLSRLDEFIRRYKLPSGTHLNIFDYKGTVLFRYPDPTHFLGKKMPHADIVKKVLAEKEGVTETKGMDGITRLYGFTSFGDENGAVFVAVGVPAEEAFAQSDAVTVRHLLWLIAISGLVLFLAWFGSDIFILRALNGLLGAAKLVGEGNLQARVGDHYGRGEIWQLSHAFNEMVDALQQRETERKQAEEAMLASEARYRKLVETSPDAVLVADPNGNILMANRQGILLFGYEREEEITCRHVKDFVAVADHALLAEKFKETFELGEVRNIEYTMLKKDGTAFPVELNASVIFDEAGTPVSVIAIMRDITERKWKEDQAQLHLDRLTALRDIDMAITGSRDLRLTLKIILEQVTKQLTVDAALVLLLDYHSLVMGYASGIGFQTSALQHTRLRIGEGHAGRAALEHRIIKSNLPDEAGFLERSPLLGKEGFKTYYAVPLIAKGHVKGVLEIFHRTAMTVEQEWLDFLEALATQAAIAIDNASLFSDLERSNIDLTLAYDTTLEGWSRALDMRDSKTEGHSQRVTELTIRLAKVLGVPDSEIPHIRRGALLHDIGKMGIPDAILLKPDCLTDKESEIMRKHPVYAHELLMRISFLRLAIYIPYNHHEKWDGTGYPQGLEGEAIPLAARIFAVVDVWDALSSERPYRPAWTKEKVMDYIREQAGTHFDPQVVEAFLNMMKP